MKYQDEEGSLQKKNLSFSLGILEAAKKEQVIVLGGENGYSEFCI